MACPHQADDQGRGQPEIELELPSRDARPDFTRPNLFFGRFSTENNNDGTSNRDDHAPEIALAEFFLEQAWRNNTI